MYWAGGVLYLIHHVSPDIVVYLAIVDSPQVQSLHVDPWDTHPCKGKNTAAVFHCCTL